MKNHLATLLIIITTMICTNKAIAAQNWKECVENSDYTDSALYQCDINLK